MNGKPTKTGSAVAVDGSRTDWARVRSLSDEEIDAAIADDPDSYGIEEAELLGRKGASYRYELYCDRSGGWRWRLLAADGEVLAVSAQAFTSRQSVETAIVTLRDALLGARSEAA
ncbi:MAG TPA: DUF1508 domain-containing protein [Allosphingosinicella sp.]